MQKNTFLILLFQIDFLFQTNKITMHDSKLRNSCAQERFKRKFFELSWFVYHGANPEVIFNISYVCARGQWFPTFSTCVQWGSDFLLFLLVCDVCTTCVYTTCVCVCGCLCEHSFEWVSKLFESKLTKTGTVQTTCWRRDDDMLTSWRRRADVKLT